MAEANASYSYGSDDEQLPQAPKKLLEQLRSQIRGWAAEDGIDAKDMKKYLLDNINVELDTLGYRPVKKV